MLHTLMVQPLPKYRLFVKFNNGQQGVVDLSTELWGEMFAPLNDEALFLTAHQDDKSGTVVWSNGADFAPEFLLTRLTPTEIM